MILEVFSSIFSDKKSQLLIDFAVFCDHTCSRQQELNQHPAFMQKIDLSKPLTPEVEGLMAMKYESDSAQG